MAEAAALLVIDMQRDFLDPGGYAACAGLDLGALRRPIPQVRRLLAAARAKGMMVIHTREGHLPDLSDLNPAKRARAERAGTPIGGPGPLGRFLIRGEPGHGIIPELAPLSGETVIDKPGYGAFYRTGLDSVLRDGGITHLYVSGVTTDVCVHSTLREAVDRGYDCVTVGDACAASDPALHEAMLTCIAGEFGILGRVATAAEVLATW